MDKKEKVAERIEALRAQMKEAGIAATVIPQTDPHLSEYLADHWQVRRWLSGFTGSAGSLVVTMNEALLWADSRYWLQGAQQLEGTEIKLMKDGLPDTPSIIDWLCSTLKKSDTVGVNGMVFSVAECESMSAALNRCGISLNVDFDVIDRIWSDRPGMPADKVFMHDEKYAGEASGSKLGKILDNVKAQDADAVFISDLAEIAWALNIRSRDVESNPVVTSFLYISPDGSTLFVDEAKLTPEVSAYLAANGVAVAPYGSAMTFLAALPASVRVLINPVQSAAAFTPALGARMVKGGSPVAILKGCKNDVQIAGIREAMIRDGVALVKSFMEIERTVSEGGHLTEMGVADILTRYRSEQDLYFDQSFDTIAGFGPHGAIVHYSANPSTDVALRPDNLLLVDSGASYLDGTTDITRTITLGNPTNAQRHDFTLVMKGHISLAEAIYPVGTRGAQLDVLARINLWKEGLSYLHGTGHGVGHFLNVHEGPQSIRLNENPTPLMVGMITSNEPGLYRDGAYGIRCENLVLTVPAFSTEFGDFLRFETLTLFPFDLQLFDTAIMTPGEVDWVNRYHTMVYDRLSPRLDDAERQWLREKTRPLVRE